jgi:uncharacterized membrane protein YdjX (TVP38/TMEM64 family)
MKKQNQRQILVNRQNIIALVALFLCLLSCWWLLNPNTNGFMLNIFTPTGFRQIIRRLGAFGPLIYIALIALSVAISPIPGTPLAVIAGAVWEPISAGVYTVIGGFLGSLIAYYIGRTLGRATIRVLTGKAIYFSKGRGEAYVGWLIFLTRLFPILPFDLISYGAGVSGLSLSIYMPATLLGMIPSTFLLSYAGSAFMTGIPQGIALGAVLTIVLIGLPWGINQYNWFGMRDIIRIE